MILIKRNFNMHILVVLRHNEVYLSVTFAYVTVQPSKGYSMKIRGKLVRLSSTEVSAVKMCMKVI